ncbi:MULTISPECIES: hypothetical protein [Bacillus cereus group]|uniref:hypothetical protein n=1 Tax=Bacillus cereus group TaxID=86661 RepID=UPI0011C9A093|nr:MULTISPECIES: hypothetical protein [Bacillus cereus group]QWG81903.1 hypothetical protein EXW27_31225 [Bacillus mycoides]TXR76654.1 hypothetical protein DN408_20750 [Bacillus sp. AR13-1]
MDIIVQDIKDRVNVQRMPDTVIQELIDYYAVITRKYLRVKPANPMKETIRTSKLAWLSFSAESVAKVIHVSSKQDMTDSITVDGRIVYGLSENQLYEFEYAIQDYDDLQVLMRKCIIDLVISAVVRANLQRKGMKTSENIGDYSYQISPETLDEPATNNKILNGLKAFRARVKPVMAI